MSKQTPAREGAWSREHSAREAAFSLVNPSTGLASDYLNVFNEILLLIEFLPSMPEMIDETLAWQPRGYREYFGQSKLPGAREALRAYDEIDPRLRARFESNLTRLTEIVVQAQRRVAEESLGPNYPESIVESCEATAAAMRASLAIVAQQINAGEATKPRLRNAKNAHKPSHENGI